MVKNLLKKEEEEALKMLGGDKTLKKEENEGEKKESKKIHEMEEEEILSEFVPGAVTKSVSSLLIPEKRESKKLEEHAAEVRLPKNEKEKKNVEYMAPIYGEKGYEERKRDNEGPREMITINRGITPPSELERTHGVQPIRMTENTAHRETGEMIHYESARHEGSGLPFMKKDDMKKYKMR